MLRKRKLLPGQKQHRARRKLHSASDRPDRLGTAERRAREGTESKVLKASSEGWSLAKTSEKVFRFRNAEPMVRSEPSKAPTERDSLRPATNGTGCADVL